MGLKSASSVTRRQAWTSATGGGAREDEIAVEEPLEIRINGETVATTLRTPGEDAALAVGFLYSEGLLRSAADVGSVVHCGRTGTEGHQNVIDLTAAPGVQVDLERLQSSKRGTLTTSACGVCGRRTVDDLLALCGHVEPGPQIGLDFLAVSTERLREVQRDYAHTGGTHAAAVLDAEGRVLAGAEDVGRHNAVDKVVGALVLSGQVTRAAHPRPPQSPTLLAVSGRVSFEIVQKAAWAGFPVVASVSAASSLAIDLAQRANVTLAAFVRPSGWTVYAHPERIRGLPPAKS